jgi:biopolymer transport protein ExbD
MQFVTRHKRKAAINIISLVDIVFLLLIFFTVTATFMDNPSITIDLPQGGEKKEKKMGEPTPMTITISKNGEFFFNDQLVRMDDLNKLLKDGKEQGMTNRLTIKADSAAALGLVTKTMKIARKYAEIDSIDVITENPEQ